MASRVKSEFPRTVDRPFLMLLWEIDEFAILFLPIILSIITRQVLFGLIIGILLMNLYVKIKRNKPENYFFHLFWKWGIINVKNLPPGHTKTFIE